MNEIGISYWFGNPSMTEFRSSIIKEAGFKHVSLHWTNEYIEANDDKYKIIECIYKNNIRVSSFHLSFENSKNIWKINKI